MKGFFVWLASFRLRVLFRCAFLLLVLAVMAMTVTVLQEEKQRSYNNYQASFGKTKEQIVARLRHPSGQLALLNPTWDSRQAAVGRPVVMPYSAIDFDDQNKVRNAVEMAGCLVQYERSGSLCVAIGNNPWAGGFIYAAGTFASGTLEAHRIGDELLDGSHRLRVTASLRGQTYRWIAPFEPLANTSARKAEGLRGRFTGYTELPERDYTGAKPLKEFRGWVWQNDACLDGSSNGSSSCEKRSFFSLRLPIDILRDELFLHNKPIWPPPDLDQFQVRVEVLAPVSESGESTTLFDSHKAGIKPPFALNELSTLLLPGETLTLLPAGGKPGDTISFSGKDETQEQSSPLLTRIIRKLPVESLDAPVLELTDVRTNNHG